MSDDDKCICYCLLVICDHCVEKNKVKISPFRTIYILHNIPDDFHHLPYIQAILTEKPNTTLLSFIDDGVEWKQFVEKRSLYDNEFLLLDPSSSKKGYFGPIRNDRIIQINIDDSNIGFYDHHDLQSLINQINETKLLFLNSQKKLIHVTSEVNQRFLLNSPLTINSEKVKKMKYFENNYSVI